MVPLDDSSPPAARPSIRSTIPSIEGALWHSDGFGLIGIGCWDGVGNVTEANDTLLHMLGYTREEFQANLIPWSKLTPPEYYASDEKAVAQVQATGRCTPYRKEYIRRDGTRLPVLIGGGRFEPEHDRGAFFVLDQADRQRAEEQRAERLLAEEHARMRAEAAEQRAEFLAEASRVLAVSLDFQTTLASVADLSVPRIADWCAVDILEESGRLRRLAVAHADPSKAELARKLYERYPPNPVSERGVWAVVRAGVPEVVNGITDELLREAAHDEHHFRILRTLGLQSAMVVPLVTHGGTIGAITLVSAESGKEFTPADLALAQDLGRRAAAAVDHARLYRNAQDAIRRRDETLVLLDAVLANAPVGLAFLDQDLRYVRVNRTLAEIDGREPSEMIGRTLHEILPEMAERLTPYYRQVLESGQPLIGLELSGTTPADPDRVRHWIASYYPIRIGGQPQYVGVVLVEITERKQAEEAVRNTQKLESIGILAGGIAHDFNNLLTGIMGNASLALRALSGDGDGRTRPLLQEVIRASERAAELTNQLLAYAGKGRFYVQELDLCRLVDEISTLIRTSIPKLVQLDLRLSRNCPRVEADRAQLQQLVMNLVINGAEAIEGAGTVTVTVDEQVIGEVPPNPQLSAFELRPGHYARLTVTDTGTGMDAATQAQIFDPFFTTKFTGRGLGLAAALGIVRGHHGAVTVTSTPGVGSTFTVLLPVIAVPTGGPAGPVEMPEPHRGGQELILVVDDEEVVRLTAQSALEEYGYSVLVAGDGLQALDALRRAGEAVALVLLDMTMPIMSGEEVIERLRAIRPNLPVIVSSGYGEVETLERFTGTPIDGFLQKPYTALQLVQQVREALGKVSGER